jgi:AmmeMemoRadiSam system protein B
MTTSDRPDHINTPHLRHIQPIPIQKDGKQFIALRDPSNLAEQTMVVAPQVMTLLQQFSGENDLAEIAKQTGAPIERIEELAVALENVGLIWGPTFDSLEAKIKSQLEDEGVYPTRATASLGEDEIAARAKVQGWFDETEDPELDFTPTGIVAPHLDYDRGWPNYAGAYYPLQETPPPDRVIILGTNHFGAGDGVVLSRHGLSSPLGSCPVDAPFVEGLLEKLGERASVDELDHLAEHSIELQIPWIQHCFGDVPVVAALIPDPLVGLISDDGQRVTTAEFVAAAKKMIAEIGGQTLCVASSDLSHVGKHFGEPRPVDDQRKFDVERHDREMMGKFLDGNSEEFVGAMSWNRNPTRWCSIGNMSTLLELVEPETIELIDYRQACDPQGMAMVTSGAMALA